MLGIDSSHFATYDVFGFGVWILMIVMLIGLTVWFARSVVENIVKMGRWVCRSDYDALMRENERLRDWLTDVQEENDYLRKLYRDLPPRVDDEGRNAA
jgi:hypothetical protein